MDSYIDLALSPEETAEQQIASTPFSEAPKYPYGLSISMDEKVLEKLNLDHSDWEVGDIFPVDVLLKVTGKNQNQNQNGESICINMQIIGMKGEEEGDTAGESDEQDLSKHGYLRYE